ncbi:MAG TPA: Fur family transcriptional regulator [Anaerolineales bacterium]|nr:Fur family transcriptional regulator [Anaerolineales bacterium]
MSCTSEYASQLRARGFRMTSQRMAILHALRHAGTHLSPREVYRQAKQELPRLTEPTVYRTLEFLAENGLVRPSQTGNGHFEYEIAGNDHHHIVCRICGDELQVEHALLEQLYHKLESTSGYVRIDSHMTFFGVCPGCQ